MGRTARGGITLGIMSLAMAASLLLTVIAMWLSG